MSKKLILPDITPPNPFTQYNIEDTRPEALHLTLASTDGVGCTLVTYFDKENAFTTRMYNHSRDASNFIHYMVDPIEMQHPKYRRVVVTCIHLPYRSLIRINETVTKYKFNFEYYVMDEGQYTEDELNYIREMKWVHLQADRGISREKPIRVSSAWILANYIKTCRFNWEEKTMLGFTEDYVFCRIIEMISRDVTKDDRIHPKTIDGERVRDRYVSCCLNFVPHKKMIEMLYESIMIYKRFLTPEIDVVLKIYGFQFEVIAEKAINSVRFTNLPVYSKSRGQFIHRRTAIYLTTKNLIGVIEDRINAAYNVDLIMEINIEKCNISFRSQKKNLNLPALAKSYGEAGNYKAAAVRNMDTDKFLEVLSMYYHLPA